MTDQKEDGGEPLDGDATLSAFAGPGLASAAGVGGVIEAVRALVDENAKAAIIEITEPDTGLTTLAALMPNGAVASLPAALFDDIRETPRFRRGTAAMTSLYSFIDHVNRFGDDDSAVFADDNRSAPKLTAVLDYNRADVTHGVDDPTRVVGEYRHGKHRTTFAFPLSDEWKAWAAANGKVMAMADFALFLEDRIGDIAIAGDAYPDHVARFVEQNGGEDRIAGYAALIELARGLKINETANVEEAVNLSSGEGQVRFSVEHNARNQAGTTVKVPTMFFISIPVFRKGAFYRIAARLRYRKTGEGLRFWYDLWRSDLSFDHAFTEAVDKVEAETPASVFYGSPEA